MTVLSATENRLYSSERVAEPGAGRGSPRTDDAAHLVILQNGLWGSPEDMSFTGKTLSEKFGSSAKIVYSTVNERKTTLDGIAQGSQRLADFIMETAEKMPNLERISFVGYSLGGIYGRVAMTELYARGFFAVGEPAAAQEAHREEDDGVALAADLVAGSEKSSNQHVPEGLDELLQPEDLVSPLPDATSSNKPRHQEMDLSSAEGILKGFPKWSGRKIRADQFVTIATPHLGVRKNRDMIFGKIWNWAATQLTGETGQQLLLLDGAVGREPLMVRISSGVFLDALRLFRSCLLYANALNDRTVPYHSASIHLSDVYYLHTPYKVSKLKVMESNTTIAHPEFSRSLHALGTDVVSSADLDTTDEHYVACLRLMHKNLQAINWTRYDAILHGRHTHGHIVVRQPMVSQDGIQVLQHLAEQLATHAPHTILRSESVPIFVLHESDAQVA